MAANMAGSLAVMQEGVEPVMQLQCRDRNRIALQSDLLSGAALGVQSYVPGFWALVLLSGVAAIAVYLGDRRPARVRA